MLYLRSEKIMYRQFEGMRTVALTLEIFNRQFEKSAYLQMSAAYVIMPIGKKDVSI